MPLVKAVTIPNSAIDFILWMAAVFKASFANRVTFGETTAPAILPATKEIAPLTVVWMRAAGRAADAPSPERSVAHKPADRVMPRRVRREHSFVRPSSSRRRKVLLLQ